MQIKNVVSKRLKNFKTIPACIQGVLGNVATGEVEVPDMTGMVYVTLNSGEVLDNVLNTRVPNMFGLQVSVGFDPSDISQALRILSARNVNSMGADNPGLGIGSHHTQHEWPNSDAVFIWGEQILTSLFVPVPDTLTINIYPGTYLTITGHKIYTQLTNIDMATSCAIPVAGEALYSIIVVDEDGVFQVRDGTPVTEQAVPYISAFNMLTDADLPALINGDTAICAVKVYFGQTEFFSSGNRNDFVDMRFAGGSGGGGDASVVTYTPAVLTDWDGDADPGNVDGALDQLAERVDDIEGAGPPVSDAADITYTPAVDADWDGSADPGNADDAFDQLAERVKDLELAGGGAAAGNFQVDQTGGTGDTYGILAGALNGINKEFTVSKGEYNTGTLSLYLNGQLLTQGSSEDWHEDTPASGTIHTDYAPVASDELTVVYGYGTVSAGDVIGPATNTANYVPQWNGADSKTLKNGLKLETSVGTPGSDTSLVSEKGIRTAIGAIPTSTVSIIEIQVFS